MEWQALTAESLQVWQGALADFEKVVRFPLGRGMDYRISHGVRYSAFFQSMGKPMFHLLREGKQVLGMVALVERNIRVAGQLVEAVHLTDFMVRPDRQGQGLGEVLAAKAWEVLQRDFSSRFPFFIALQGKGRDLINQGTKAIPSLLHAEAAGDFRIFFVPPGKLQGLQGGVEERFDLENQILFSLEEPRRHLVDLSGVKDLLVGKNHFPLSVVHATPHSGKGKAWLEHFREAAFEANHRFASICFAVDSKRKALLGWLAKNGINSESRAVVYVQKGQSLPKGILQIGTYHI